MLTLMPHFHQNSVATNNGIGFTFLSLSVGATWLDIIRNNIIKASKAKVLFCLTDVAAVIIVCVSDFF